MRILRFGYTNVTATLALFVALGGTSYAAVTLTGADVRNGTVTGADLGNGSVKGREVTNGGLTGSDLKNGSVTTSDIGDRSLRAADFATGQRPAGPPGPPGTTRVLARRAVDVALADGEQAEAVARCGSGEVAVSGGAVHDGTIDDNVSVVYSQPLETDGSAPEDGERATGWLAGAHNLLGSGVTRTMTVFVLCAKA
jgi:hypothetical protein